MLEADPFAAGQVYDCMVAEIELAEGCLATCDETTVDYCMRRLNVRLQECQLLMSNAQVTQLRMCSGGTVVDDNEASERLSGAVADLEAAYQDAAYVDCMCRYPEYGFDSVESCFRSQADSPLDACHTDALHVDGVAGAAHADCLSGVYDEAADCLQACSADPEICLDSDALRGCFGFLSNDVLVSMDECWQGVSR